MHTLPSLSWSSLILDTLQPLPVLRELTTAWHCRWMFNASMPSMPSGAYMPSVVTGTSQTVEMMTGSTATA